MQEKRPRTDLVKQCPFCKEQISVDAIKCKQCGEFISNKPAKQRFSGKFVALVGILTAVLSLFYPLREGYFYFQTKQEQRNELESYKNVANLFEQKNSLSYAKVALTKALLLAPNDTDLQQRLFLITAEDLLREVEWLGSSQEQQLSIEPMVLEGYRLVNSDLSSSTQAQLLLTLARLLPHDRLWNDVDSVTALYQQAMLLKPNDPEIMFRLGQWLIDADLDYQQGLDLITAAVNSAQDDAMYAYELGVLLLNSGDYQQALNQFQNAINLLASQKELQRVRSANFAKSKLKTLLVKAHQEHDVRSKEFIGLDVGQRGQLIEKVLADSPNDRSINLLAAQYYFAYGSTELAQSALEKVIRIEDLYQVSRGRFVQEFTLYKEILNRAGKDTKITQEIESALDKYQQSLSYDEILDIGVEGQHRYKIGLKIASANDAPGLMILETYSGYPFAKAGVVAGDILLQVAHRQAVSLTGIYNVLSNFKPGTSIPILLTRDDIEIEKELIVE